MLAFLVLLVSPRFTRVERALEKVKGIIPLHCNSLAKMKERNNTPDAK